MNSTTVKIIQRKELVNTEGVAPLAIQAFINGQRKVISINLPVPLASWNGKRIINHPKASDYNLMAERELDKARDIFIEYRLAKRELTTEMFAEEFSTIQNRSNFLEYYEAELNRRLDRHLISHGTFKGQKVTLNKLKVYKSFIPFTEITTEWLENFDAWHNKAIKKQCAKDGKEKKGESVNTRAKALAHIKSYFNKGLKKRNIKMSNPFDEVKIIQREGEIIYLEQKEIADLHQVFKNCEEGDEALKLSIALFMFSCFSSLRISDSKRVQSLNINGNNELKFMPQKTSRYEKIVTIPLNKTALYYYKWLLRQKHITIDDVTVNRKIKIAATRAHIQKHLTTHVARHTFATQFIETDGNVVKLQQILAHGDIRTTMRYVHMVESKAGPSLFKGLDKILGL